MELSDLIKKALIEASTTFRQDQFEIYKNTFQLETNENSKWILGLLIENAKIAQKNSLPLCDDTGIPHVIIEIGPKIFIPPSFFKDIQTGIENGLRALPGRPMAVRGNEIERIEQKKGLFDDPGKLVPPPFIIDETKEDCVKIHILMLGGGPEIRSKTYRVFHQRNYQEILKKIVKWMKTEIPLLGCTPCIPAVGIGRTHFEASTLMLKAMVYGNLNQQSKLEKDITRCLNDLKIGALGIGGSVTALGSFVNIGPQRASGVRIICMRPCCCMEPRRSSLYLTSEFFE
jgi:fumarate hydratase subunit alpha